MKSVLSQVGLEGTSLGRFGQRSGHLHEPKEVTSGARAYTRFCRRPVPDGRCAAWIERLREPGFSLTPARDLYSGDHWHVVCSLAEELNAAGRGVSFWVCSAGYGLIPLDAPVRSYAATFAPNQSDSVDGNLRGLEAKQARQIWWAGLSAWEGPFPVRHAPSPNSRSESRTTLLVAGSASYLDAMSRDLLDAAGRLERSDRLAVFSAGTDSLPGLDGHLIPCDARLQGLLGGALSSLNARCLRFAFERAGTKELNAAGLRDLFGQTIGKQPERRPHARTPLSDEDVRDYIRAPLKGEPRLRPTPLLRRLRESGRACEHSRFTTLFREVEGVGNG